jgi:hypothetical protein
MKSGFLLRNNSDSGVWAITTESPRKRQRTDMCLYAWGMLLERGSVSKGEILNEFGCSVIAYKRGMASLQCFVAEHWKDCEIQYSREQRRYVLVRYSKKTV